MVQQTCATYTREKKDGERERDHKQEKNKSTDFMPTIRRLFIYGGKHLRLIKGMLCSAVFIASLSIALNIIKFHPIYKYWEYITNL